jgi:Methyltransferase domain
LISSRRALIRPPARPQVTPKRRGVPDIARWAARSSLDINPESIRAARERGFEARQVDLDLEEIDAKGFDVVIFAEVLDHLRRPEKTLRQVSGASNIAEVDPE